MFILSTNRASCRELKAGATHGRVSWIYGDTTFAKEQLGARQEGGGPFSGFPGTTFAMEHLSAPQEGGGSILGVPWNKRQDTIELKFPTDHAQVTKRGILVKIARVHDPLGL